MLTRFFTQQSNITQKSFRNVINLNINFNYSLSGLNKIRKLNFNNSKREEYSLKKETTVLHYSTSSKPIDKNHIQSLRKCWSCNDTIKSHKEFFCPICNKVQPPLEQFDIFYLFDIEPTFHIDQKDLSHRFKQLQRQLHPDLFEQSSDIEKQHSKQLSTSLNAAYNILRSPLQRAEYLLEQNGYSITDLNDVDEDLLAEVLEVRELIDDAQSNDELVNISNENKEKINQAINELEQLFSQQQYKKAQDKVVYLRYLTRIQEEIHYLIK
ncbi:hypothetical protein DLAC_02420 [Tieghemostelium lacteum]|uniref:J domain-containing protein n=1 Tax=Tieghemostelium lacteum TaxID=361077 RepID=A0A152A442_TIELA|nr:hypothetical protein DLAC_02420 [Tieghemostelium lacteum]|eukprot:KYR00979.1 hypothetical protein DLAC_02420 [Tieghemostelium lacteum]